MMIKPNICIQIKNSKSKKDQNSTKSNRGNSFINLVYQKEMKSPPKFHSKLSKKESKEKSKSSNQNKTEMNTTRLKVKKEQKMKELTFENQ